MTMKTALRSPQDIDEYIAGFSPDMQELLTLVRRTIRNAAPEAKETIKYGIPTFVLRENLVHFGGFKHHIGFYPSPTGIEAFKDELSGYAGAKGSVRFPVDKPMPLDLIEAIVRFRVKEVQAKPASVRQKR